MQSPAKYLEAIERGETVDRERFVAQHSEFAVELRAFFADLDSSSADECQADARPGGHACFDA